MTIRRYSVTADSKGGFDPAWSTVAADVPAEVVSQNGREAMIGATLQGVSAYRITIRRRPEAERPRAGDQIVYRARSSTSAWWRTIRSIRGRRR